MLYMVTFTVNIPPMVAYIPYMDPMGICLMFNRDIMSYQWDKNRLPSGVVKQGNSWEIDERS